MSSIFSLFHNVFNKMPNLGFIAIIYFSNSFENFDMHSRQNIRRATRESNDVDRFKFK